MYKLDRDHYKQDGTNKYHVNCTELEKNSDSIPVIQNNVIQNRNDITILQSIITEKSITTKQRNIVVKIGKSNKTIEKEFYIGKTLEKINGFINYMCLFTCYDNTFYNIETENNKPLCSAKKDDENLKTILIMPFIFEGSIKKFNWYSDNIIKKTEILKSLLLQVISSIFVSYHSYGFLHNDLHLDNILVKKIKKETLQYSYSDKTFEIKIYGYKSIIMDFENSMLHVDKKGGNIFYWNNIYNLISRISTDLTSENGSKFQVINSRYIISFIEEQMDKKNSYMNTLHLLDMIPKLNFILVPKVNILTYNQNIF